MPSMKHTTLSCLLIGLSSASPPVAPPVDFLAPTATPLFTISDFIKTLPTHTSRPEVVEDQYADIELRQNLGVDLNPGSAPAAAAGQVPPVTTYSINVQQGATAVMQEIVYTQTFAAVLEQFPKAKSGAIGYGTLQKRAAEAEPTPGPEMIQTVYMAQTVVLAMETVLITQPVQRVTELTEVQTARVTEICSSNATVQEQVGTVQALRSSEAYRVLPTALPSA